LSFNFGSASAYRMRMLSDACSRNLVDSAGDKARIHPECASRARKYGWDSFGWGEKHFKHATAFQNFCRELTLSLRSRHLPVHGVALVADFVHGHQMVFRIASGGSEAQVRGRFNLNPSL